MNIALKWFCYLVDIVYVHGLEPLLGFGGQSFDFEFFKNCVVL